MPVVAGNAVWYEDNVEGHHLWVVLNTPTDNQGAIFLNFTGFEKYKNPPMEISAGYIWIPPSTMTSKRTTIHAAGSFVVSKAVLEREFSTMAVFDLCPKLLTKVRNVMINCKCDKSVQDLLTNILITGWK